MQPAMNEEIFDTARADACADRLMDMLNMGALSLMVSVGHRTGLFDALAALGWSTPAEIAAAAGLNERYVREWLGALAAGRLVTADSDGRYLLPAEHAAFLCRRAEADNLAIYARYIGQLGSVENEIVECFRHGGGLPCERFERFQEIMAEDSGQTVTPVIDSQILQLAPGLPERLRQGICVLEAGCGRGMTLTRLAEIYPRSRFHGIDLSDEAISFAREQAGRKGLRNISFTAEDLSHFDITAEPDAFELVFSFGAVHDQAMPLNMLKGVHRTLTADGVYIMHAHSDAPENLDHPLGTLLYAVSCMHCMTVSLAQGGEGLGAMWGREKARELLGAAGFRRIEIKRLDHDIQNDWYVIRK